MPRRQSSEAVSAIAGKYARMTNERFWELTDSLLMVGGHEKGLQFFRDVRKLAASCLAQDETKGQPKASKGGER